MEVPLQASSFLSIFLSSYERVSALVSKIEAWIRPQEIEELKSLVKLFDKLPYKLLLSIFETCKDPIDGYTFVKAVAPRLDEYWERRGLVILRSWYENTLCDAEIVKLRTFPQMPVGYDHGILKYYRCFTLKSSILLSRFLHKKCQDIGRQDFETRFRSGRFSQSFSTVAKCEIQDAWRRQFSGSRGTREILHQHIDKYHKGATTGEVLYQCLFECDYLSEYKSTGILNFISITFDDESIPVSVSDMDPSSIAIEKHLLLTLEEFRPLLKYHLLQWSCDHSAFENSLQERDRLNIHKSEYCIDKSTKFIKKDTWMLEKLDLLDVRVSKKYRNFVATLRGEEDWEDIDWSDDEL